MIVERMPQLFDMDGEHTSIILAFWPDPDVAARIAQIDGVQERADDLHVTLAFCGKGPDMTDAQIARIIDAADVLSREYSQFVVTLSGIGRFDNGDSSAIWAGMQSDQLQAMNARAKELLADRGIIADASYGDYTPHMTLAYIGADDDSPVADFSDLPVLFNALTISVASRRAQLPLQETRTMTILERLRNLIAPKKPVKRDMMMHLVWENVYRHFEEMNRAGMGEDEYGESSYDPNKMHWFQELYVGAGGSLFALSVQAGKLYRSAVVVGDDSVVVGMPEQVVTRFEPLQRTRIITRLDNNLPVFLSILATAALNKANELDTRALFDDFVERFTGEDEYVNVYHLGKSKSRIGKLLWVGRDENLLLGLWTPDDNIVGRSVAETIAADTDGEWGVSIEFLPDDDGRLIEVVPGIELRAFEAGELWGASIVRSAHACSWFTGHAKERIFRMNKDVKQAIETLIKNPDALAEFETWVDGTNRAIADSGAITRADETAVADETAATGDADLGAQIAVLTESLNALAAKVAGITNAPIATLEPAIEIGPEAAEGIAQAVFSGEAFRSLSDGVARLSGALEAQSKQALESVQALTARLDKLEGSVIAMTRTEEEKLREHDERKPKGSTVTVAWRAPRGKDEQKPDAQTLRLATLASKTLSAWEQK